ncbi:MAG: metallophosphoesterase family protein [Sphingomonadales bacterium]|nr:metallophosphoesterase family protein [Sphingomonadales bacterium]
MRIGLLSDTHGYVDESLGNYLKGCDEIWHAGDFGNEGVIDRLQEWAPLQGVYGNIDPAAVRKRVSETLVIEREGLRLLMRHILPRPNRYDAALIQEIKQHRADLVVCGHSHIALAERSAMAGVLHLNPGAAGRLGWHTMRTLMRFSIICGAIQDLELIELDSRFKSSANR